MGTFIGDANHLFDSLKCILFFQSTYGSSSGPALLSSPLNELYYVRSLFAFWIEVPNAKKIPRHFSIYFRSIDRTSSHPSHRSPLLSQSRLKPSHNRAGSPDPPNSRTHTLSRASITSSTPCLWMFCHDGDGSVSGSKIAYSDPYTHTLKIR